MPRQSNQWLIPMLLAVGVAGALWYYRLQVAAPVPPPAEPPPAADVAEPPLRLDPVHPLEMPDAETTDSQELVPLPPLDESDAYFKLGVVDIFGVAIEDRLAESGVIEKIVATVDNLPRATVAERIRPLRPIDGFFMVDSQDASGEASIAAANSERYAGLVTIIENADLAESMTLYRRFYPLFQKAYTELGYPNGYFNDRLVEVIDHLLATPEVVGPIELVRPNVLYEYRDPQLEALSGGQKLLLRMGEENSGRIRNRLREIRAMLTSM